MTTTGSYKQNKFNLLREQTEGYTKLVTEISGSLGPPHDSATGLPIEWDPTLNERAKIAWKKVLGLIGDFYLDPNRALDIVLDMFVSHAPTHYSFFLALLRQSPWCRYRARKVNAAPTKSPVYVMQANLNASAENTPFRTLSPDSDPNSQTFEQILRFKEDFVIREEDSSPICAQIIGFKFAHY